MKHDSIRSYKENGSSIQKGDLHDINHFMKVYAYAKTIAEGENLTSGAAEAGGGDSSCA